MNSHESSLNQGVEVEARALLRERLQRQIDRSLMTHTGIFEESAERFYRETGLMAPGKSVPLEMCSESEDERRRRAWDAWLIEQGNQWRADLRACISLLDEKDQVLPSERRAREEAVRLVAECAPYLKDGETPAECIARNRADIDALMSLLAKEKARAESAEHERDHFRRANEEMRRLAFGFEQQLEAERRAREQAEQRSATLTSRLRRVICYTKDSFAENMRTMLRNAHLSHENVRLREDLEDARQECVSERRAREEGEQKEQASRMVSPGESANPRTAPTVQPDIEAVLTRADAERTVRSLAAMLGWLNVPPRATLEADLRAVKARASQAGAMAAAADTERENGKYWKARALAAEACVEMVKCAECEGDGEFGSESNGPQGWVSTGRCDRCFGTGKVAKAREAQSHDSVSLVSDGENQKPPSPSRASTDQPQEKV